MVKKAGRPPGAQNKVGKDEKEFIKGLLGDTQEQYREAFLYYANNACRNADDRKFFVSLRNDLSKMIDATMNESQFAQLMGKAAAWDDDLD